MGVHHRTAAVLALGVLDVHAGAERPRTIQRVQGHQVFEPVGRELADQRAHAAALQLEHADGVALPQHLVGRRVVQREVVDVDGRAPVRQQPDRVLDDGQVPQPEEVHLQQAELLDAVHVELRDDAPRVVARVLGELQRQVVHQRHVADDDAGRVDRVLAPEPLQRAGRVHHLARLRFLLVGVAQFGRQLQRVLDRVLPSEDRRRVHLAEPVAHRGGEAQDSRRVPDPLLPLDRLERDDLRDVVGAVPVGHVLDDLVAAAHVEVHVDVGHLLALGVQEALEDQPVPQRVEVGDPQAVRDHRAGGRPAARADPDAALAREPDQVPDDQEVAGEPHVPDDGQLRVDARADLGRRPPRSARPRLRRPGGTGTRPATCRPAGRTAAGAACRTPSSGRRTRRSRASRRTPRATARTAPASPAATSGRTRRCRTSAARCRSAPSAAGCTAGRRGAARPRARCSGCRWSPRPGCRSAPTARAATGSAAAARGCRGPAAPGRSCPARTGRGSRTTTCRARSWFPASSSRAVSEARQPESAVSPSACSARNSLSVRGRW